jgi:hypothetical protein
MISIAVAAMPLEFGTLVNASRTCSLAGLMLASVAFVGSAATPVAAQNYAPPQGAVIDLSASGGAIPSGVTQYTSTPFYISDADIVNGAVPITFAFRNDSFGLMEFWGAALFDVQSPQVNLLANGDFNHARLNQPLAPWASSWTYTPPTHGSGLPVSYFSDQCPSGNCWVDATKGGYDELSQRVQSVVLNQHDQYEISFFVSDPRAASSWTWRQYSTVDSSSPFGGNGADILAYAGPIGAPTAAPTPPPCCQPVPEPSTWAAMLLGFAGLGFLGYLRGSARASTGRT